MDFEEFEVDIERAIEDFKPSESCTVTEALNWIDSTWYAPASRNARWMDEIGDYAGTEPFVIDRHSLLQVALDDHLLVLAKDDANFEIVCFDGECCERPSRAFPQGGPICGQRNVKVGTQACQKYQQAAKADAIREQNIARKESKQASESAAWLASGESLDDASPEKFLQIPSRNPRSRDATSILSCGNSGYLGNSWIEAWTVEPMQELTFKPDAWQREVLNAIDQNMSLLVVGCCSSYQCGKISISYYAMEKNLQGSDDGILVYIAPTKALVAQVAAEIYARFSKDLNDRSCWAIHSRNPRVHDTQNCQILVSVSEILCHPAVWEQILLLSPCPVTGISVTAGAPERFHEWLESVQKAGGFQHKFVHYPCRYSHLRKFYYNIQEKPRDTAAFHSLSTYKSTEKMRFLHPLSILSSSVQSLPSDLALEAVDALSLYRALSTCTTLQPSDLVIPPYFYTGTISFIWSPIFTHKGTLLFLNDVLETREDEGQENSPEWKRKMAQYDAYLQGAKERERKAARANGKCPLDPMIPSHDFPFTGQSTSYPASELDEDIVDLARRKISPPQWALKYFRHGIAVHVPCCLFRHAFVRIIFRDGTAHLRLYLQALLPWVLTPDQNFNFLQRLALPRCTHGYRVQRLVLSKLPSLSASFPVTSIFLGRLFNLLEGSDYSTTAAAAVQQLFRLPQISFGSEEGKYQLLHHLRFSIDYLPAHLYYMEPSNLALVALLCGSVIQEICVQPNLRLAKRNFIQLMAHLRVFGRRYLPSVCMKKHHGDGQEVAIDEREHEILKIFTGYALTYGTQHQNDLGLDHILPLSQRIISGTGEDESLFTRDLDQTAQSGLNLDEHTIPSFEGITRKTNQDDRKYALNAHLLDFYVHGQVAALAAANAIRRGDMMQFSLKEFEITVTTIP
ncbi:hypothetical protein EDD22DRAFT_852422 [Suillus occidentalis]|nr:hypothetical protein EDD22DRAFT_852422 [Suillus occidentalis]